MSNEVKVNAPELEIVEGKVMTTSFVVAEYFGKRHSDVIRAVRNLECSSDFNQRNFASVEYKDAKGEARDMFRMTKDGFTFLVMGFTGKIAAEFKEAYINEFNRMQDQLADQKLPFWNQASVPPHDKFLEKMVTEAGKGNRYAKAILQLKYDLEPQLPKKVRCPQCANSVNVETANVIQPV